MTRVEQLLRELHEEISKDMPENVTLHIDVCQHIHQAHDRQLLARSRHKKIVGEDHDIDRIVSNGSKWYSTEILGDRIRISTFY